MRGLYIHIPFCNSVCIYCDFTKMVTNDDNKNKYINRLLEEIDYYKDLYYNDILSCDTVFIGGGTPNSISLDLLERLFIKINNILEKSKENTIELNPELITEDLLLLLKKYHFNRLSIGVETFNDEKLKLIRRKYDKKLVYDKIKLIKDMGFSNINIDLIFGLPFQTLDDIKYDLNCFKELNINHLSYYDLILENSTILNKYVNDHKLSLIDDDIEASFYDYINKYMADLGYNHYEVSNYAIKGYESIHNQKYWDTDEYYGVGLGASGYLFGKRYKNNVKLDKYLKEYRQEEDDISYSERKKEYIIFGLRKLKGISIFRYKELFNSNILEDFDFNKYLKNGIIVKDDDYLRIKEEYMFISNTIIGDII